MKKTVEKKKSIFDLHTENKKVDVVEVKKDDAVEKTVFEKITIKEGHNKTNNKISKKQKRNHDIKTGVKKTKIDTEKVDDKKVDDKKENKKNKTKIEDKKDKKNFEAKKDNVKTDKKNFDKKIDDTKTKNKNDNPGVKLTKLETEILHKGTIKDKKNLLTLIVEKNPTDFNYKNLLFYTENQRNDIIYMTLKNIKDLLISKGVPKTNYIRQKITKSFDINVRNTFIKTKVLRLVYDLLKNDILFVDLIYMFINKIGDKKDIETYVREGLTTLVLINEEAVLYNVEDFIFKNMNFKCINSILKFLGSINPTDKNTLIELLKIILENSHEYKDEQKNIILENCLEQLSSLIDDTFVIDDQMEGILRTAYHTEKMAYLSLKILHISKSKITKKYLILLLKNGIFIRSKNLQDIYSFIIFYMDNLEFIKEIFNSAVFYRKEWLIAILSLLIKNKISDLYLLDIVKNHYSNIVRKMVNSLIKKEYEMVEVDPFDKIQLEAYEEILK